ncbi:MAG: hypothetical protein R3C09_19590 [Pirellulaceae bacterium]
MSRTIIRRFHIATSHAKVVLRRDETARNQSGTVHRSAVHIRGLLERFTLVCLFAWLCMVVGPLPAAPPQNWEVMRVFIRDQPDQISQLVTRHYKTVLLDDLSRQLAEQDNLRKIAALQAPALQEALYVARLEGELIVSDQSRWQLNVNELAQPLELGNISLALRGARGLVSGQSQLLDRVQFTATGAVELQPLPMIQESWFGFSASGQSSANQQLFRFLIPAAPSAKLLLATAASVELSSPTLVVQKIATPQAELPKDWPEGSLQSTSGAPQWWLVHLSGVSRFELVASQRADSNLTRFHHLVRSAIIDYVGSDSQLSVQATFELAGSSAPTPLRLRVSAELKIESVTVEDQPVEWRVQPSQSTDTNLIELVNLPFSTHDRTIELKSASPIDLSAKVVLPPVAISEGYVLDGLCRLWGENGVIPDQLNAVDAMVERKKRAAVSPPPVRGTSATPSLLWQTRWLGNPPKMNATFSRLRHLWKARSLTRLSMQAEWLSANCRMQLESSHLTSNEIRLPVGSGWFIDAVRLIQSGNDFRARIEDRREAASPVIVIYWDDDRDDIALELEVVAHAPRDPSTDTVSLQVPRLVTLPHADQLDNYVIETSGRFDVQMDAELLSYQRSASDLPDWQQRLLPEQSERWIFQPVRGAVPTITLTASSGTFSSQVATLVHIAQEKLNVDTLITFTPIGGAIDHVSLLLPASPAAKRTHWTLQQPGTESTVLSAASASADDIGSVALAHERLIELELPSPMSGPFTLMSRIEIPVTEANSPVTLPIVGVPQANTTESTLLLPRELAAQLEGAIELLPVTPAISIGSVIAALDRLTNSTGSTWLAAHVEAGTRPALQVGRGTTAKHASWAWSESLQHSLLDNGLIRHDAQWSIEATNRQPIEVQLPQGWRIEQLTIGGVPVASGAQSSRVLLDIPPLTTTQVSMSCTSRQAELGWLSYTRLDRPKLSLPILESRQTLSIPPSRTGLPLVSLPDSSFEANNRLIDRLVPSAAWSLLAPTGHFDSSTAASNTETQLGLPASNSAGWKLIELPRPTPSDSSSPAASPTSGAASTPKGLWTIRRTALAAHCLALVLIAASLFWIILGGAIQRWWLMIAASAVALIVVPLWLLPLMQLLSLSLLMAALLRLGCVVCRMRDNGSSYRGRSSVVSGLTSAPTTSLLLLVVLGSTTFGQTDSSDSSDSSAKRAPSANLSVPTSPGQADREREIFSVLIPIDEAGEVAGAYAYAPTRLLELLAGGEANSRSEAPRILSADYTLRMQRSLLGQHDRLQEVSVEFRLQVTQAEVELRLPFNSNQLLLQRGNAAGQELYVGGRGLEQEGDAVVFRPSGAGTIRLQLQFDPLSVTQSNNQAKLRYAIPPIPNATLRIEADSNSSFEVRTAGAGRKSIVPRSTDLLGPVDAIDLQWSLNKLRGNAGQAAVVVYSDTWLHARGDQLAAVCQLRIDQAHTLPRDLHLLVEPGWVPVGVHWQDGELIGNELSSPAGQRVYTLRCGNDWDSSPRRVLRVMMVADNVDISRDDATNTTSIPFFSLREVSPQAITRTLSWSAEPNAAWRPEGLDYWQELTNVPGLDWGGLGWDGQYRLYRIANTQSASLIHSPPAPASRVEEVTDVHLGTYEARTKYRATLAVPSQRLLTLLIPANARVESVRVDEKVPNYRVTERNQQALIEILPLDGSSSAHVIEVELSQAIALQQATPIPRVVLRDFEASSSLLRILRAAGLDCQIESSPTIQMQATSLPPHELLPQLEMPVGQFELRNAYRETPWLPLDFQLQLQVKPELLGAILSLHPMDQGWRATVRASWQTGDRPLDYAFFDLPIAVRDSIDTNKLGYQLVPHGDASRVTLRLLPPPPEAGLTTVEFSFPLPNNGSAQAVSIPHVSVVADTPLRPILALPEQLDGQAIQWAQAGRRLEDIPNKLLSVDLRKSHLFYELETSQSQISWKRFEDAPKDSRLLLSRATLLKQEQQWISGSMDYWIQPSGQINLELAIPKSCDVLGVELGGQPAVWQFDEQKLSVLMQPNSFPINIRLLLHWRVNDGHTALLSLPELLNATSTPDALHCIDNQLVEKRVKVQAPLDTADNLPAEMLMRWGAMLATTWPTVNNRPSEQVLAWLLQWHPQPLGLPQTPSLAAIISPIQLQTLVPELPDELDGLGAEELWQQLWLQSSLRHSNNNQPNFAGSSKQESEGDVADAREALREQEVSTPVDLKRELAAHNAPWTNRTSRQLLTMQDASFEGAGPLTIELEDPPAVSSWSGQLSAAGLLALAALLLHLLAIRISASYMRLLAHQPWIYWLQLSGLAWFLLPVSWPSWVLALTAVTMVASQNLESRRRRRLLARV